MSDDQKPKEEFQHIGDTLGGLFSPEMFAAMEQAVSPEVTPEEVARTKKGYQPNEKLVGAAAAIIAQPPTKSDFAYITTELVQCSFPQRDPGDVPAWIRRNGDFTLIIQPGIDPETGQSFGLPSGETPRIFMPWAFKEMYVKKTAEVDLPETENEFIRSMGGEDKPSRGKRSYLKTMRDQLIKLANCKISLHHHTGNRHGKGTLGNLNVPLTRASSFWWDLKNPDQRPLFKSRMVFDDLIYQSILERHIPIDYRVLIALKHSLNQSSFAIDVYKWWKYRLNGMQRKNQAEIYIKLEDFMQHFGTRYSRIDNFRTAFREALLNVQQICPELDFEFVGPYFVLKNTRIKTVEGIVLDKPPLMLPHLTVSDKTRSRFVRAFPDHDVELALTAFYNWLPTAKADPGNINAFFWSFAETWTKNNPPERVFF